MHTRKCKDLLPHDGHNYVVTYQPATVTLPDGEVLELMPGAEPLDVWFHCHGVST